jgi:hypothetical protein
LGYLFSLAPKVPLGASFREAPLRGRVSSTYSASSKDWPLVINKRKLVPGALRDTESFHQYVVGLAFEIFKPYLRDAWVDVDRTGSLDFGRKMVRYLSKIMRQKNGKSILRRARAANSKNNNLLQLADMVCGAIARSFRLNKPNKDEFRNLIRHRELSVLERP